MIKTKFAQICSLASSMCGALGVGKLVAAVIAIALPAMMGLGQTALPASAPPVRDGSHDFDFNLGAWHTHIERILDPFTDASGSVVLDGTVTGRKLWDGRAEVEEIEADGPKGHWEGMTVFLYDPQARQWSMNFVNSSAGKFSTPMIGGFENGRGELIGQDTVDGRSILVRGVWSEITPTSHTYQESYSADGGRTWKVAFTANKTKK